MQPAEISPKPYTARNREIYAWGVGGVANHALICTFGQVSNLFILGFGLSPILVSWVMTIPRLFDGIVDPILGHLSDNAHTRWGRRKPFLVIGSVLAAAFLVAIWFVNRSWPVWAQFSYLLACTTLFYTCWGIYSMAWTAIGYELTDDYHERSRIQGIAGLFLTIVLFFNTGVYWFALRPMFGDGPGQPYQSAGVMWLWEFLVRQFLGDPTVVANEVRGIRWIGSIVAGIALAAGFVCTVTCRERFVNINKPTEHPRLRDAMKATMRNRPFIVLLIYRSLGILGGRICGGVSGFLGLYYVCGGNKELSMGIGFAFGIVNLVIGLVLMPFMGAFSRKIGKRQALTMGAVIAFVLAVLAPFLTRPGHPYLPLIPGLVLLPLTIIANTLGDAMLPDICDYDELQYGQRREGLFTSVLAFFSKLEMSAAALGVGYLIAWTGYDKGLLSQSDVTLNRMWWLALIPNIAFTFAAVVIVIRFPLTEEIMNDVRQQLDRRHAGSKDLVSSSTDDTEEVHEPIVVEVVR